MKTLIHTMYYLPEFGSAPILMDELASFLTQKGHTIEVVTTIPRQRNKLYRKRLYLREWRENGFYAKRFWANAGSSPIGRLLAWNIYTLCTIINILTIRKGDILFLRLPPLQLGLTGIIAKSLKGCRIIVNVQDIHPDLAIESAILKNPLAVKLAKDLERWIYAKSENIIVISEGFKENLEDKGVSPEKIQVIPNWVDTDFLRPLPRNNEVARRLSLTERFVVLYSGTITLSSAFSLEQILEAARLLKNEEDILFALVGEGIKKGSLQEKANELGLQNVRFFPFQPYPDLPHLLASSDLLLVPLDREKAQLSVPSKLYSFMAAGRPILGLADLSSEVARIIHDARCGVCIPPFEAEKVASAIVEMKNSKAFAGKFGANARKFAAENFSKDQVLRIYEEAIYPDAVRV